MLARRVTSWRSVAARVGQSQNGVDSFPWDPILPMPKARPSARTSPLPSGTLTFLFTDIEGSTRLWEAHSEAMREAVARHDTLMVQCIAARNGHVFKTGGDAFYAAFATAPDALAAALTAQQTLRAERWPEALPIRVRMAVHTGAAEFREGDYFGSPLNQAARLLALGHGGQTLVSDITHGLCRDRLPVGATLKPLGEHLLKDFDRSEEVFQLCHAGLPTSFPPLRTSTAPSVADATPSIAVLPFTNLSAEKDQEYFADGLAEELINVLSKIRGLRVASRTSAFHFKGKDVDIPTIAQSLNVATVLEGSVRKSAKRVRITSQLVEVATDSHLWSETYDRELEDIFAVQDDIAQAVVKELRAALLGEKSDAAAKADVQSAAKGRTDNPEAYRLYLQARFLEERQNEEDLVRAIDYYQQALVIDSAYALTQAGLSRAYTLHTSYYSDHFDEGFRRAREAAERALQLEPELAEAHDALGRVHMWHDFDWKAGEASIRRALELAPGSVHVIRSAAVLAGSLGKLQESIALFRRATVLDPLNAWVYRWLALALLNVSDIGGAAAAAEKAVELSPRGDLVHKSLGLVRLHQGRLDDALKEVEQETNIIFRLQGLAIVEHARANPSESDLALQQLIGQGPHRAAFQIAEAYAFRGNADASFEWLERAHAQHDAGLGWVKVSFMLQSLHQDPRWRLFLEKMGLAD
jgi:TolB-like protein/class 3 adenylate cyclase